MGKNFSREQGPHSPANIYVVDTLPTKQVVDERISSDRGFILLEQAPAKPQQGLQTQFQRRRSWHSFDRARRSSAMFNLKKSSSGTSTMTIHEEKAYYLETFQTSILTNAALDNLRNKIRHSKLKRTKIKLSASGLSFGSKPGGLLQNNKVPYQFIPIGVIESIKMDTVAHDVLLCVHNNNHLVRNGHGEIGEIIYAYEINAFHMERRDALRLQHTFKQLRESLHGGGLTIRSRAATASLDQAHGTNRLDYGSTARHTGANGASSPQGYIVEPVVVEARSVESPTSKPIYVYDGSLSTESTTREKYTPTTRDRGISVNMHGASGILDSSSTQSHTTRVYFLDEVPLADVECQVKPLVTANGTNRHPHASTSRKVSVETTPAHKEVSSGQFRSRSSSATSRTSKSTLNHPKNESMKQQLEDLSREIRKIQSLMDTDEATSSKKEDSFSNHSGEGSTSSDSTLHKDGPPMRKNYSPKENSAKGYSLKEDNVHAGRIDTRAGLVDVHVDSAPKTRRHPQSQDYRSDYRSGAHSRAHTARDQVERRASERNTFSTAGPSGRYVFYQQVRPVTPEPVLYRRSESPAVIHGRSRSTEPPAWGRKKNYGHVVYR